MFFSTCVSTYQSARVVYCQLSGQWLKKIDLDEDGFNEARINFYLNEIL